jgi:hypothetical protein
MSMLRPRVTLLGASVLLHACSMGAPVERERPSEPITHSLAIMPGPNQAGARDPARLDANDECRHCHVDIAREWAGSSHALAHDDPFFQAAFARERESSFCRGCHAPEADPARPASARAGAIGVGCVSCHLDLDGTTVLAGPGHASTAPHPLRRDLDFAGPEACARCHEFGFPDERADPQLLMQSTISEHQASDAADQPCQSCHMPTSAGHRSHRFVVDAELLAAAATISAERNDRELLVTIEPRALGHAFPTGDLFRRLHVQVASADGSWSEQRFLARRFDLRHEGPNGAPLKVEVADERVAVWPGPTLLRFAIPTSQRTQSLSWSVSYQRVLETPIGAAADAEVWDQHTLASGSLAP